VFAFIEEPLWESDHQIQQRTFCLQLRYSCTLQISFWNMVLYKGSDVWISTIILLVNAFDRSIFVIPG